MSAPYDVVVIGAGQAGLAMGWHLQRAGASFVILDGAPEVGHSWRTRWDSLRLFTPARYDGLPGTPFPGDPAHHPDKDEVADYLRDYAAEHALPVLLGRPVRRLSRVGGRFVVETPDETLEARQVVVATGPFQTPFVPALATGLAPEVTQVHSADYRNPGQLPDGPVVVVGAGNSGLQIALELASTRPVTVAVGDRAPALPQTFLGRDVFWWLTTTGLLTKAGDSRLGRRMRSRGELVIGTGPGDLTRRGVELCGRLTSADGGLVGTAEGREVRAATVVWATGFRPDWSWIDVDGLELDDGWPAQVRGVTDVPGLFFLGLPWQHSRGSALLGFVGRDAGFLSARIRSLEYGWLATRRASERRPVDQGNAG